MADVTATEAARRFSDLLDAVEHHGQDFTIVRRGKVIARLQPAVQGSGALVKELLRSTPPDPEWQADLQKVRDDFPVQDRL